MRAADVHGVDPQPASSLLANEDIVPTDLVLLSDNTDLPEKQQVQQTSAFLTNALQFFEKKPDRITGLILLNVMAFLCGANWVVVKQAGDVLDPVVFAALRFWIAATACLPFLLFKKLSPGVRVEVHILGGTIAACSEALELARVLGRMSGPA
jgi:hypothetical protein